VINAYRELWVAHRDILSEEARRSTTSAEFAQTYHFIDVLDTLTGKTATLSGFQRVRGMLRILAKTVGGVWQSDRWMHRQSTCTTSILGQMQFGGNLRRVSNRSVRSAI